jgi:hypothetical protein
LSIGETINELILIAEASFDDEYQDQIIHLPISTINYVAITVMAGAYTTSL